MSRTQADPEVAALTKILAVLGSLEPEAQARVLAYVCERVLPKPPTETESR